MGGNQDFDESWPKRISHYLIENLLGEGAFGKVYLALDTRLDRKVAIKVLDESVDSSAERAELGLREARVMAALDHPNMVPVYDIGKTEEGATFFVSKFIDGETLAARMRNGPAIPPQKAAEILAKIARALHHAHEFGLVHRDVKPGNIVLDADEEPFLIDFGLALLRGNLGRGRAQYVGTPPYMSPEQARGEGHLVNGRSDVFSLGVILYELLTGTAPFDGATMEMLREIEFAEFAPPRQLNHEIPKELERICLRALARLPGDRPDAAETESAFAEELTQFLRCGVETERQRVNVIPKGLHCFDEEDAGFFLELLPGPRNQEGLPLSVARWKQRIKATDPERTFRVGLVYGPSGSGKSSLVRSGLLPQLDSSILPVFVEAEANTEQKLVYAIHHRFPRLDSDSDLRSLLRRLREGEGAPAGCKILLVIDQFEQFLHRNPPANDGIIRSLRQCDGVRLLSLLIVRDDFWMRISKVFSALEIEIDTGRNAASVDLFDSRHAEKVLAQFGRSFGKLPREPTGLSRSQKRFVRKAIREISEENRTVPVRLALFAEMFRNRPWRPAELQRIGGMTGLGAIYLEDCIGARVTGEVGRRHAVAARKILEAFLPGSTATMKGSSLSRDELSAVSGHERSSPEFQELLTFLTRQIRLLRPADGGKNSDAPLYGLAHDYLVPGIRKWIDTKNLETRSGRAALKLRETADRWAVTRHRRLLPTIKEWCQIRLFTSRSSWSREESELMTRGGKRAMIRTFAFSFIVAIALTAAWEVDGRLKARKLFSQIFVSKLERLGDLTPEVERSHRRLFPMLRNLIAEKDPLDPEVLHARMVLYQREKSQQAEIAKFLEHATPAEFGAICRAIRPLQPEVIESLRAIADAESGNKFGLRAKLALFAAADRNAEKYGILPDLLDLEPDDLAEWTRGVLAETETANEVLHAALELEYEWGNESDLSATTVPKRRAKAALALLALGETGGVRTLLEEVKQPDARSFFLQFVDPENTDLEFLLMVHPENATPDLNALRDGKTSKVIGGLLQALREFRDDPAISNEKRKSIISTAEGFLNLDSAYIHGSAQYLLGQRWGDERTGAVQIGEWFTNPDGDEFVVLPEFDGQTIAIMRHELSKATYLKHRPPQNNLPSLSQVLFPNEDGPVLFLPPAAIFKLCNELSTRENLDLCFYQVGEKWFVHENHRDLSGYRVPTRSEWDFAFLAGAETRYHFGDSPDLLPAHAWILINSKGATQSGGLKLPNAFGLHDILGNAREWTLQKWDALPSEELTYTMRGGSFQSGQQRFVEDNAVPYKGNYFIPGGYRLVRTMKPRSEISDAGVWLE